jgi:DNA polymerase-3 subunit gamma/tau
MQQSELLSHTVDGFVLRVPIRQLAEGPACAKARDALSAHFGRPVRLDVRVGEVGEATAAAKADRQQAQRLEQTRAALESDPFVRTLLDDFGGRILPESIRPTDTSPHP